MKGNYIRIQLIILLIGDESQIRNPAHRRNTRNRRQNLTFMCFLIKL